MASNTLIPAKNGSMGIPRNKVAIGSFLGSIWLLSQLTSFDRQYFAQFGAQMTKVLIIDDSALMRKINRDHLEEAGYAVDDFMPDSVAALVDRITATPPDLVLSDFNMPNVDGMNVARTVRRTNPNIPVIILTANRDVARESMLQTMGVRKILHKPIHGADLIGAIGAVLAMS
ncbi:MAG TPA: response regulator [Holophaga sp.]|jgi:DNA-binding response OmpR family regulator|nr:response regulator [Holophaga sp.]